MGASWWAEITRRAHEERSANCSCKDEVSRISFRCLRRSIAFVGVSCRRSTLLDFQRGREEELSPHLTGFFFSSSTRMRLQSGSFAQCRHVCGVKALDEFVSCVRVGNGNSSAQPVDARLHWAHDMLWLIAAHAWSRSVECLVPGLHGCHFTLVRSTHFCVW